MDEEDSCLTSAAEELTVLTAYSCDCIDRVNLP